MNSRSFSGPGDAVPMATGHASPVWPLPAVTRRSWNFGNDRGGGARHHAGVDLYARAGSEVLAPESGVTIGSQRFLGPRAVALLVQLDSGLVALIGEVFPGSWQDFGLRARGSRFEAGDPIARVGITPGGSSMLHFELYTEGTRRNARWYQGSPPPANLLNPTQYLQSAKALDVGQQDPSIDDDDDPADEHPQDDPSDDPADDPADDPGTSTLPTIPTTPGGGRSFGLLGFALLFGALMMLEDDG